GGFGGPPAGGPPGGAPPANGGNSNAKLWIGLGVGCLVFALVACLGSYYYCKSKAEDFVEGAGGMLGELQRIPATIVVGGIKTSCTIDPSGAGTAQYFHPQAFSAYQGVACQINDQTQTAISNTCTPPEGQTASTPCTNVTSLVGTPDEGRATALGLPAAACHRFSSGSMVLIGCSIEGQGFKIIHLENPAGVL
ncbi:MAG: hypothetical protein AAF411_30485, partial [Myxococcota bacterium]